MLLIGVYTGTRPGAILGLRWLPSPTNGWFDLDAGVLHRAGGERGEAFQEAATAGSDTCEAPVSPQEVARQPTGSRVSSTTTASPSPSSAARGSGCQAALRDGPHVLRHTGATWLMQAAVDVFEASGYLGMTVETLLEVYGHHHPSFQEKAVRAAARR
jgi:integrase